MEAPSEFPWKRFSQSEDFTVRLRNILHDYAFGPGVFRELLQNADDARARRFAILADENDYRGVGLLDSRLEAWQGSAICAFNDAEFSDADFEGICRVGASGKSADHAKIGRYGLGFNATYHLTDIVSFASRDRLCIFDPHEAHLPGGLPGLQMRLPETQAERQKYAAQLAPFEVALSAFQAEAWPLKGALFRLPLRTPELAKRSQICRESHDFDEVLGILRELLRGAQELLLFLQSVESLEILVRPAGGETVRLGGASLRTAGEAAAARLRAERRLLSGGSASSNTSTSRQAVRWTGYTFLMDVDRAESESDQHHRDTSAWMVMLRAEPASDALSEADSEKELPDFQCGAIAFRLWPPSVSDSNASQSGGSLVGHAFCFLPLALATGLPVHISANFALTANRRDLWRRSDDKASSHSMRRAAWNEALLQHTLPRSYADALKQLANGIPPPNAAQQRSDDASQQVHNLLPEDGPWQQALRGQLPSEQFWALWPAIGADGAQGIFEPLAQGVAAELFKSNAEVLWIDSDMKYAGAKSAMLCSASGYNSLDESFKSALARMRAAGCQRSVSVVPDRLRDTLSEVKGAIWMKPQALATCLRSSSPTLQTNEVDAVVEYLLSGGSGPLTLLHGLSLAPLVGGGLGRFEKPGTPGAHDLWWTEEASFCELLPDRGFVDPLSGTFRMLKPRVANAPLNIRLLNLKSLPLLLPALVPPAWCGKRAVTVVDGIVYVDGQIARLVQESATKHAANVVKSAPKQSTSARAGAAKGKTTKAKTPAKNSRGPHYDDYDWEDDGWSYEEEYEYGGEEDWDEDTPSKHGKGNIEAEKVEVPAESPCECLCLEDLDKVIKRCHLLWQLVERGQVKGVSAQQVLGDLPCIPVVEQEGAPHTLRLVSIQEAIKRHALAVEDFTRTDRAVIALCGVPFVRPGKLLRTILGLEKSSTLGALQVAFADRWSRSSADDNAVGNQRRLLMGLKPHRIPLEEARALRTLLRSLVRKNLIPKDSRYLEALPIFETQGGRFAVPLAPSCARIISPGEEWDEALRPDFGDYLITWVGEAGEFLSELGYEPGHGVSRFLAEFAAPRVGLFDQALCVRFLEAVASLGSIPWKKSGAPKELAEVTKACIAAPLVVFPAVGSEVGRRCLISDLTDPGDMALRNLPFVSTCFPPEAYCGPLALSVMRKAGLQSLTDESAFLKLARRVETSSQPEQAGAAILGYLGERHESLKFSSKAYTALGKLRIFPSLRDGTLQGEYPPVLSSVPERLPVALDGPCTLFQNGEIAWTQLTLLDPEVFDKWPTALLRRFGALKDPVPLEVVMANLTEVSARWGKGDVQKETLDVKRQQAILEKHLAILLGLSKRSHATNIWAQQQLSRLPFLVLDDGTLTRPTDIFVQLHSGGDSDADDEKDEIGTSKPKSSKKANSEEWTLPAYLRPYRRLLLSVAGPSVNSSKTAPSIHVGPSPAADAVPKFLLNSLNQPDLADVQFLLRDEEGKDVSVYAHRLILAAASQHFMSMFTSGYAEAVGMTNGRVLIEMPDWVSPRPLLWVLAYLYQGFDPQAAHVTAARLAVALEATAAGRKPESFPGSKSERRKLPKLIDESAVGEDLCCLLRLADLYDLAHLKQWTEQRLQKLLNPDNVVAISTHAFFCNGRQLLRLCVYHMRLLYGSLAKTEEWDNLEPAIRELVLDSGDDQAETEDTSPHKIP